MDVSLVIKHRLTELGLDQKDLAAAAQVTDSYISQLLGRKKAPPAPNRTDIYEKIGQCLKLPGGELARLAEMQRRLELKKKIAEPPGPLFKECRELIVRKCVPETRGEVKRIFEKEPFGELERLVTQKILDVTQELGREELRNEGWLRQVAQLRESSYEQMRVAVLELLDSDVLHVSADSCVSLLEPMIESWNIDLRTFALDITLNPRLVAGVRKRFAFLEVIPEPAPEPGFVEFLHDRSLSGDATPEELEFLRTLRFGARKPAPLYYYRELQNLRDPLHFRRSGENSPRR